MIFEFTIFIYVHDMIFYARHADMLLYSKISQHVCLDHDDTLWLRTSQKLVKELFVVQTLFFRVGDDSNDGLLWSWFVSKLLGKTMWPPPKSACLLSNTPEEMSSHCWSTQRDQYNWSILKVLDGSWIQGHPICTIQTLPFLNVDRLFSDSRSPLGESFPDGMGWLVVSGQPGEWLWNVWIRNIRNVQKWSSIEVIPVVFVQHVSTSSSRSKHPENSKRAPPWCCSEGRGAVPVFSKRSC